MARHIKTSALASREYEWLTVSTLLIHQSGLCFPVFAFCRHLLIFYLKSFSLLSPLIFITILNRSWFPGRQDNTCASHLAVNLSLRLSASLTCIKLLVRVLHLPIKFSATPVFSPEEWTFTASVNYRSLSTVFNNASSNNQVQFPPCVIFEL